MSFRDLAKIIVTVAFVTVAPNLSVRAEIENACRWTAGQEKIGIVCGDAMEFTGIVISCEMSPLYLWIEGDDCQDLSSCPIDAVIDGRHHRVGPGTYVPDGYAGTTVSLKQNFPLIDQIAAAHTLSFTLAGKPTLNLPVVGLSEAMDEIKALCRAKRPNE